MIFNGANLKKGEEQYHNLKDPITTFIQAIEFGDTDKINQLLDLNLPEEFVSGMNCFLYAIFLKKYDIANLMLSSKFKNKIIDAPNNFGLSPIFLAITQENTDFVQQLINNNANVNIKCRQSIRGWPQVETLFMWLQLVRKIKRF